MAKEEIEILISSEGRLKIHIKGVHGPSCVDLARDIASGLGKEKSKTLTNEYYEKAETKTKAGTYIRK